MKTLRYLIPIVVFASILFASYSTLMALVAEPPGDGGGGGGNYGKWYHMGTILETKWCDVYTAVIVFFPPPPHYEIRHERIEKDVYWSKYKCGGSGNECTIGTERKDYLGGGC